MTSSCWGVGGEGVAADAGNPDARCNRARVVLLGRCCVMGAALLLAFLCLPAIDKQCLTVCVGLAYWEHARLACSRTMRTDSPERTAQCSLPAADTSFVCMLRAVRHSFDTMMFRSIWGPCVHALGVVLEHAEGEATARAALEGLQLAAR
jgi:hypothetical protein